MSKGSGIFKTKLTFAGLTGSLAIVSLIVVILAHAMLFLATSRSANDANEQSASNTALNTASNLSNLVNVLSQGLIAQAGDSKLAGIITQADPGITRQEEERITRAVSSAWLVRLLPENLDVPDETRSPKMGFSDLDMVTNAVSETMQPAVHLANSPDAHLAMAQRLANGGGVIHASWPVKLLNGALAFEGACGIALRQENINIAYQGDPSCKDNEKVPDGEVDVKGTPWKIAYWVRPGVSLNIVWFVASLLVSIAIIGGLGILLIRLQYAALRQDRKSLLILANDMINGSPLGDFVFKISEIEHIATEISRLKRVQRDTRVAAPRPEPQSIVKLETPADRLEELQTEVDARSSRKATTVEVSPVIFRANDIRGILGETINSDVVYAIGLAIGSEMNERGENFIAVGHDGRLSSPELCKSVCKGLTDTGRTVINIGLVPTPLMHFATHTLNAQSGVIVTGSHNPPNYNGLKIVLGGISLSGADIQNLRIRIENGNFSAGKGRMNAYNLLPEYIERVVGDTQLGRPLKIVMDCGNGSTGVVAPKLIRSLGCEVIELYCEVDGRFPNHHPDPGNPENLQALIKTVLQTGADLGIAYDGDGDRLGMVDSSGKIIWPDRQLMVLSADVLSREPGADIIYDVKCTRNLPSQIVKNGGRPILAKSGHASMAAKLKETGAMLAGEMSGHIFYQERWYGFDDAVYASTRMIEILSNAAETSAEMFAKLPDSINTPEMGVLLEEGENISIMAKLLAFADFSDARITDIDGLRVDFLEGWGLVRASNTLPALTFRFEADNEKALDHIQEQFRDLILAVKPDIKLPF
ncbi:MAG: phosphomannomutase/phosphoglucomutase [Proteobacteria bacterium]|nr:phosphomannomutase/phosphoglucomutase [Pseudomonadota bacterium]